MVENHAIPKRFKLPQPKLVTQLVVYPRLLQGWQMFSADVPTGERMTGTDSPEGTSGLTGSLTAHEANHKSSPAGSKNRQTKRQHSGPAITVLLEWRNLNMLLILLEALGAGAVLVLIVWWTMFSGRQDGERKEED